MVELTLGYARLCARRVARGLDANALHVGQVNDQSAVAGRIAGYVVAATADGHEQIVFTSCRIRTP